MNKTLQQFAGFSKICLFSGRLTKKMYNICDRLTRKLGLIVIKFSKRLVQLITCNLSVFLLCLDFPGFSCTYIEKYAHLDFSFQMRNTAFRLLWSKVKRSKIGLFSGPFLLTGRVLISLFTNSPKIYLSVHRVCHLLLQNIFLCRRKKVATEVKEHG